MNIYTYNLEQDCEARGLPAPPPEMVDEGNMLVWRPREYVDWVLDRSRTWRQPLCRGDGSLWYATTNINIIRRCRPDLFGRIPCGKRPAYWIIDDPMKPNYRDGNWHPWVATPDSTCPVNERDEVVRNLANGDTADKPLRASLVDWGPCGGLTTVSFCVAMRAPATHHIPGLGTFDYDTLADRLAGVESEEQGDE